MSQFREVTQAAPDDEPANTGSATRASLGVDLTDNTPDASKPVSTAQAAAIAAAAAQAAASLATHTSSTSNPHSTTKAQVGLSAVDNTPDTGKPVSTAQAAAIAAAQAAAQAAAVQRGNHTGTQAAATISDFAAAAVTATASAVATRQKKITVSATAPVSPEEPDEWIDTTSGIRWTWIVDEDSGQWVELGAEAGGTLPAQVSGGERTAGTETALRMFAPLDVKTMVLTHAPVSSDGTLAADSSTIAASQSAVRDFVEAAIAAMFTTPTLSSATINAAGTSLTLVFSKPVKIGTGGNGGFLLNPTGADVTLTYASGSGTSTLVYTISRAILRAADETAVLSYTQPADGVEDLLGVDLATISTPVAVTNNSTQVPADVTAPTLVSATINAAGTTLTIVLSEAVSFGAGGNGGFVLNPTGADVTLTYVSGAGTTTLVFTISRAILQTSEETAVLDYTQPTNGAEDAAGNDLASFTGSTVTNDSTQTGVGGGAWTYEIPYASATSADSFVAHDSLGWSTITLAAQTVTKLGVKIVAFVGTGVLKLGLYNLAGTKVAEADITITGTGEFDADVTPVAVSSEVHTIATITTADSNLFFAIGYSGSGATLKYKNSGITSGVLPSTLPVEEGSLTRGIGVAVYGS